MIQIVLVVTILGFLWVLRRDVRNLRKGIREDIAGLRERMTRVESLLEGFVGRLPESQS